jgi:hypothetical protein
MALTINQDPASSFRFQPAQTPVEYLVNSSETAQPNFKLNVSIHYDVDGANTLVNFRRKPIEYGTTKCIVDINNVLRSKDFEAYPYYLAGGTSVTITQLKRWNVAFQEFYGTTPAAAGSIASGTSFPVWQAAFRYDEYASTIWKDYVLFGGQNNYFMTPFENYASYDVFGVFPDWIGISAATPLRRVQWSESLNIRGGLSQITGVATLNVAIYDENYTQLDTRQLSTTSLTGLHVLADWRLKPSAMEADYGFSNANMAAAKYIEVFATVPTNLAISQVYFFEIVRCDNPKWGETFELAWMNHVGGWDTWVFNGKWKKNTRSEKQTLKNNVTRRISGTSIVNDRYARIKKDYHTGLTEEWAITTDNLNQIEYNGLGDLVTSPNVFWNDGGVWRAVVITSTDYEGKTNRVDRLMSLAVSFEIDADNVTQRW